MLCILCGHARRLSVWCPGPPAVASQEGLPLPDGYISSCWFTTRKSGTVPGAKDWTYKTCEVRAVSAAIVFFVCVCVAHELCVRVQCCAERALYAY